MSSATDTLVDDLKRLIITTLDLEDIEPQDIDESGPLFGEGLGLDSIDALELGVELQKQYQFKIDGESEEMRKHFYSVQTLAKFVSESRAS